MVSKLPQCAADSVCNEVVPQSSVTQLRKRSEKPFLLIKWNIAESNLECKKKENVSIAVLSLLRGFRV
jgi:hypothetical protein